MRIGIITQPLINNFGGLLQNYALQAVLKELGHYSITIDQPRYPHRTLKWEIRSELSNLMQIVKHRQFSLSQHIYEKIDSRESLKTKYFSDHYIVRTPKVFGYERTRDLSASLGLDAFIVGSDQVWRPIYNGRILNSFLDFTQGWNVKRIAYAASFGVDQWEYWPQLTNEVIRLIKQFDAISVRELSGVELCEKFLMVSASLVLDPTMLLSKDDYVGLIEKENEGIGSDGNLFCYILDPSEDKTNLIKKYAEYSSLKPFSIMPKCQTTRSFPIYNVTYSYPSVTQWLCSFLDAKFVITDSFHGVVFSLLFNKPFLAISNSARGASRFHSLLSLFGLSERVINPNDSFSNQFGDDIDWNQVNAIREYLRQQSVRFLNEALIS